MTVTFQVQLESEEKFTKKEIKLMRLVLDTFTNSLIVMCPTAAKSYMRSAMHTNDVDEGEKEII